MRKQINTNSLRDTIFGGLQEASEEENIQITKNNNDLLIMPKICAKII